MALGWEGAHKCPTSKQELHRDLGHVEQQVNPKSSSSQTRGTRREIPTPGKRWDFSHNPFKADFS